MVNIGQFGIARLQADGFEAVEAASFLVAVQTVATAGDIHPTRVHMAEQQLIIFVELNANKVAGNAHRPGLFDKVPARSGFKSQVLVLLAFAQMKEIIRQADAVMGFTLINEKAFFDLAAIHIVEGINHVGKTTPYRGFN